MRLAGNLRDEAKFDLLDQLARRGPLMTGQLVGTARFHGMRTLTLAQIRALLRETGLVTERVVGDGMRTSTLWTSMETEAQKLDRIAESDRRQAARADRGADLRKRLFGVSRERHYKTLSVIPMTLAS